ncbi:MAG: hypothetical protein ACOY3D_05905 [Candidatus Omnitrophota bacterium]
MAKENLEHIKLKTRYLVWLYKTTKEAVDRVDRKFTQLEIDRQIRAELVKEINRCAEKKALEKFLKELDEYIAKKETEAQSLKNPAYVFLKLKLTAVENSIERLLDKKSLEEIKELYQQEMLRRIIEAKDER